MRVFVIAPEIYSRGAVEPAALTLALCPRNEESDAGVLALGLLG